MENKASISIWFVKNFLDVIQNQDATQVVQYGFASAAEKLEDLLTGWYFTICRCGTSIKVVLQPYPTDLLNA